MRTPKQKSIGYVCTNTMARKLVSDVKNKDIKLSDHNGIEFNLKMVTNKTKVSYRRTLSINKFNRRKLYKLY